MKRQHIRKLCLLIALLLFPITMWYFSPAIISMAMMEHVMNGSFFVFMAMLVLSMFFGRVFCSYLCPAGGLQECAMQVNDKIAKQDKRDYIKFVIWFIWIVMLIVLFIMGKNDVTIDFFYMTDHGISVTGIYNYVTYYGVILLLILPALISGRRASCHYICWMAPFMVIGSKIGRFLHFPQLHIEAEREKCVSCKQCNATCPMGLAVEQMVQTKGNCVHAECIQCGACVDKCPKNVLHYSMKFEKGRKEIHGK